MKEEIIKDNNFLGSDLYMVCKTAGVILVFFVTFILKYIEALYEERPDNSWLKSKVSAEQKYKNEVLKTEIIEEDAGNEK